jgi:hypothetical protein
MSFERNHFVDFTVLTYTLRFYRCISNIPPGTIPGKSRLRAGRLRTEMDAGGFRFDWRPLRPASARAGFAYWCRDRAQGG